MTNGIRRTLRTCLFTALFASLGMPGATTFAQTGQEDGSESADQADVALTSVARIRQYIKTIQKSGELRSMTTLQVIDSLRDKGLLGNTADRIANNTEFAEKLVNRLVQSAELGDPQSLGVAREGH